jgi:hypothetical protein
MIFCPSLYLSYKITQARIITTVVTVCIPATSHIKHAFLFNIHHSTKLTHRCNFSLVMAIKQQAKIFTQDRYISILHFKHQSPTQSILFIRHHIQFKF